MSRFRRFRSGCSDVCDWLISNMAFGDIFGAWLLGTIILAVRSGIYKVLMSLAIYGSSFMLVLVIAWACSENTPNE